MSEIISIQIQADNSGADEALQQVNTSLKEGKEAAEALNHVLDGDLAGAFKSLGDLGKTLGITLDLAFSPAEIVAFVQIIAEVADKLSKLIADTFIYTDEQKALDAQIRSSNQVIAGYATDIKKLDDEFEKMGKTASQKTAIDIAKLKSELEAASEAVFTLTGDLDQAKKKAADPNNWNALGNANAIPGLNDALGVAQQHQKVLLEQMRNLTAAFHAQQDAELEAIAQAEISGRLRVQEASVNSEKAKWDRIRELTHTSADQNLTVQIGFENRLYQVKKEALRERLELMKLDPDHNGAQITAINRELEALAQEHETALTRIKIEGDQARRKEQDAEQAAVARQAQETMRAAQEQNNAEIKAIDERQRKALVELDAETAHEEAIGELKRRSLDFDREMGRISLREHNQRMKDELAAERDAAVQILRIKQALYDKDSVEFARLEAQIQKLHDKTALAIQKVDQTSTQQQEKRWQQLAKNISSSISGALNGWIQGTQTLSQAWGKMADDMAMKFIDGLERQLMAFIEHKVVEVAVHAQTEATKEVVSKTTAEKNDLRTAYSAAKNAFKATAGIDVVGPILAPIAAAAAFAGVVSFGSAEGGQYYVPNNQLTMLHAQEMVLPAGIANQMRSVIGGGGSGGSGVTVVVNHSVNAVDASSFQSHIRKHAHMIGNEVARALKRKALS